MRERNKENKRLFRKINNETEKNDQKVKKNDRKDEKHN